MGRLEAGHGAGLYLGTGTLRANSDVDIAINDPGHFECAAGKLQFIAWPGTPQNMEVLAADLGAVVNPADPDRYAIGELNIGPLPSTVALADNHDNSGSGTTETLYVRQLTLEDGITLVLNGANVYYLDVTIGSGVTIDDSSGGALVPIDCNGNSVPDYRDRDDCDGSAWCDDCNGNGILDQCDLSYAVSEDCQPNGLPDECDIAAGTSADDDGDVIPDECDNCDLPNPDQADCQPNGIGDVCDIAYGTSEDYNGNGVPDECDQDEAIPAVSDWGVAVMVLAVLTVGTLVLMRKRAAQA